MTVAGTSSAEPGVLPPIFTTARNVVPIALEPRCRAFVAAGYRFIDAHEEEWSLAGNVELEVTNHVLRVRIQDGSIIRLAHEVEDLCRCQHADGGWGNTRDEAMSQLRSTAFCAQMLLRANRLFTDRGFTVPVRAALAYILNAQRPDGSWCDSRWHHLDAVSVSVGTLLFAVREPFVSDVCRRALTSGLDYVRAQRREDGLWYYRNGISPVTITAHLLQKLAVAGEASGFIIPSVRALLALQDHEGYWDRKDVDHTCDTVRSLMLCASTLQNAELTTLVNESTTRALSWLLDVAVDGGMPDRPGRTPHVERTCDALDTILKYYHFTFESERMRRFWQ